MPATKTATRRAPEHLNINKQESVIVSKQNLQDLVRTLKHMHDVFTSDYVVILNFPVVVPYQVEKQLAYFQNVLEC